MTIVADTDNSLCGDLREIALAQKVPAALAEHLEHYFADADVASFGEVSPESLHGAAIQHHRLGRTRTADQALVACYTPGFDQHGWHSAHTVVDIVTDDMPFLVDSITMLFHQHGLTIHRLMHPLLGVERDAAGVLQRSAERGSAGTQTESWIHVEIDRIGDAAQLESLRQEVGAVLADVRAAVEDHLPMRQNVATAINDLEVAAHPENAEIAEFLRWIAAENFVFLGYAYYRNDGGELRRDVDGGLGLLRRTDHPRFGHCLASIPGSVTEVGRLPSALTLVKADTRSTLHRPNYLDFIGVHHRDAAGQIVGEHVFVGLYAMHVYHISTSDIPVVRRKVAAVRATCGFAPGSYRDKALINVLETYPREELIEIGNDDLQRIASGIVMLQEHPRVRVFMRDDSWGRYVSALVYMPRDGFDTTTRKRIIKRLSETLQAASVDFFLMVGESRLARLHLIARLPAGTVPAYDAGVFENEVARIVRGWHEALQQNLIEYCGEERGSTLLRRYAMALPFAYQDEVPPTSAVADLERLETAEKSGRIEVKLNAPYRNDGSHQHVKLFLKGQPRPLSTVLPVFENLGLTVLSELPFNLADSELHIADFAVQLPQADALDDVETRAAFVDLLEKLLRDEAENDGFNRLALLAGLDDRSITVLRAYARYLRQAGLPFSSAYIERCLAAHPGITRLIAALFDARFSPEKSDADNDEVSRELAAALAKVSNVDDDRILSGFRTVIEATMRTNAWQVGADGKAKPYLSFKISSKLIPFLPKPVPLYEIFVYNQRMEGVHLRGSRVSRGGLRWSDRMEDYRTEGLALVKAQMVKNVVGVPLGAKGCFVGKRLPPASERDAWMAEGIACYQTYIRGLLDVTDNLKSAASRGAARRRPSVFDADDPYLVVAADKGTATFSDYRQRASPSSTASGWATPSPPAVQPGLRPQGDGHHLARRLGIGEAPLPRNRYATCRAQDFTVVGVGDMSGDVFGNGMLRTDQMQLLAAFDHRHIFLDPNPDPKKSLVERQRLFDLPRSSWDDYDKTLISQGGGVYPRSAKTIPLSPEMRARLAVDAEHMTPNELMNAILKAPVDLLYNGGIGTYFKASSQSHQDANDRSNDPIRVDATEIRAKVVGEGGNLGFTQKARIEYALAGGLNYTDAIDNSAGVGTSDHEVNIKILMSSLIAAGDMTLKQRDALLASMTEDVGRMVLVANYQQTAAVSLEVMAGAALLPTHAQLMRKLETKSGLDRQIEFLPDDKAVGERSRMGRGLTAPEISVLLAYSKIALKEAILASSIPDAAEFQQLLVDYFPPAVLRECAKEIPSHPLRREVITTQIVSRLVNRMGTSFALLLGDETGASLEAIVNAWYAASDLLGAEALWAEIEALDLKVPSAQQMALMQVAARDGRCGDAADSRFADGWCEHRQDRRDVCRRRPGCGRPCPGRAGRGCRGACRRARCAQRDRRGVRTRRSLARQRQVARRSRSGLRAARRERRPGLAGIGDRRTAGRQSLAGEGAGAAGRRTARPARDAPAARSRRKQRGRGRAWRDRRAEAQRTAGSGDAVGGPGGDQAPVDRLTRRQAGRRPIGRAPYRRQRWARRPALPLFYFRN